MTGLKKQLLQHPFFENIDPKAVEAVENCAANMRFDEEEYLFRSGDKAEAFYLIQHGLVAIQLSPSQHSNVNIQNIGAGEILGWSWLVPPHEWQFDARACEFTQAIVLNGNCLKQVFNQNPIVGYEFTRRILSVVSRRLQATRVQFWDIYKMHYLLGKSSC